MRRPARKKVDAHQAVDPRAVREAAFAHLARRDFATGELILKLASKGYDPAVSAAAVAALASDGYINDARFCENYVVFHANRGEGPARIEAQLKALDLPCELIDTALAGIPDWRARAHAVRVRRFGLELPKTWPEKGRQARFLQYRGFSSDHIRAALGTDFNPDD
jgi:regulatory protein